MKDNLIVLAPPGKTPEFGTVSTDLSRRNHFLAEACRVRARAYLKDGAILPEHVDGQGGFRLPIDENSWHLLALDDDENAVATLRLMSMPVDCGKRRGNLPHVGESLRRANPDWGHRFAAERFVAQLGLAFGQTREEFGIVGGWAVDPACENYRPGASMALGAWAICRLIKMSGALGIASERHDAHGQLMRTGAVPIKTSTGESLYYDSAYGCRVGLLGFWVYRESHALRRKVDRFEEKLRGCEVLVSN